MKSSKAAHPCVLRSLQNTSVRFSLKPNSQTDRADLTTADRKKPHRTSRTDRGAGRAAANPDGTGRRCCCLGRKGPGVLQTRFEANAEQNQDVDLRTRDEDASMASF